MSSVHYTLYVALLLHCRPQNVTATLQTFVLCLCETDSVYRSVNALQVRALLRNAHLCVLGSRKLPEFYVLYSLPMLSSAGIFKLN